MEKKCDCENKLTLVRTCQEVYWRCRECGKSYPLGDFPELMDDELETLLSNTLVSRI